jgi:ribosomal-protein-alanine N-acetyltransferase
MWAVTQKGNPSLIGTICLWNIIVHKAQAEIGYELLPGFQGKGIMQEAIPRVIRYAFEDMALRSIVAVLEPGNLRSVKLLQKHNFVLTTDPEYDKEPGETVTYILYRNLHEQQAALI